MVVISDIKERTQTEIILEQGAKGTILTQEGCNNRSWKKNYIMRSFITCTLRQI
jgi:hypothetical protein